MRFAPGCPLDVDDHRRHAIHPRHLIRILRAVGDVGDVGDADRRAIPPGEHHRTIRRARAQLIVGRNRGRLARAVEAALCLIHVRGGERRPQILEAQASGGERGGIGPHANRRLLPAVEGHHADAGQLRDLLREPGVGKIVHRGQRQGVGGQAEREDGCVGRVALAVEGRVWQV
jgi:hypothetical protein